MKQAYAVFLRNLYVLRSSPSRIVPYLLWAAVDIVLWGFITRYLDATSNSGLNFVPILLGAVLLWDFLTRIQQGVTTPFLEDVWQKNFLNIFASPITVGQYLWGFILISILTSAVGLCVMLLLAYFLFHLSFVQLGAYLLPFGIILFLCGIALGIFGAGLVLRFGPSAEWLIWPIPAVLSPFCAVFYPLSILPAWMQPISYALAPSYVFEGMRTIFEGGVASSSDMLVGILLSLVYLALSYLFFMVVYRTVLKRGLIARFSAEGV